MLHLAIRLPIAAITGTAGFGAVLFAEATPADYATPGVIISVLFAFIGACAVVLYKVVLAPLFNVFIKNLEAASNERTTFLASVVQMNEAYGRNLVLQNKIMASMERQLRAIAKGKKLEPADDGNPALSDEASV